MMLATTISKMGGYLWTTIWRHKNLTQRRKKVTKTQRRKEKCIEIDWYIPSSFASLRLVFSLRFTLHLLVSKFMGGLKNPSFHHKQSFPKLFQVFVLISYALPVDLHLCDLYNCVKRGQYDHGIFVL